MNLKKNAVFLLLLLPCFLSAQTAKDSAQNYKKWGVTVNLNSVGVIASK